jgi:hypothetical protein
VKIVKVLMYSLNSLFINFIFRIQPRGEREDSEDPKNEDLRRKKIHSGASLHTYPVVLYS